MIFLLLFFFQSTRVEIVKVLPHDAKSFTQGLVLHNKNLYESTGLNGQSYVYKHKLDLSKTEYKHKLNERFFGEGLTILNNKVYQITWKSSTAFVYDSDNLKIIKELSYGLEGWGLTNNGKHLLMSDGSAHIYTLNPENLEELDKLSISYNGKSLEGINELEYINGYLWANVLADNNIYKIDLSSGDVIDIIDLSFIAKNHVNNSNNVLNGIAYDSETKLFYITGKKWNKLYVLRIKE